MIQHTVRLFGPLCEKFGANCVDIRLPANSTISDLIELMGLQEYTLKTELNGVMVDQETVLHGESEIALLPPVSGG